MTDNTIDYKLAFEALPGSFISIKPDAPLYTVLSVSDEILYVTARKRKDLVGKSIFEVYPENPEPSQASGPSILRNSLQKVIQTKVSDKLPMVRYDVSKEDGLFEERYWIPTKISLSG